MVVYVVTHKPKLVLNLPKGYCPILVGADSKPNPQNFLTDNTGINISSKNPTFCELTALYEFWKNKHDDFVGLSHYRRYFSKYKTQNSLIMHSLLNGTPQPIEEAKLKSIINNGTDWIVAEPQVGGVGSLQDQFAHFHHLEDLETTRQVIQERYPKSIPSFDKVMNNHNSASFFNMFYTSYTNMNDYCEWLFDILFEVENRVDISHYDNYQKRLFGFLAERLLNVWLEYSEANVAYLAVFNSDHMTRLDAARMLKYNLIHGR